MPRNATFFFYNIFLLRIEIFWCCVILIWDFSTLLNSVKHFFTFFWIYIYFKMSGISKLFVYLFLYLLPSTLLVVESIYLWSTTAEIVALKTKIGEGDRKFNITFSLCSKYNMSVHLSTYSTIVSNGQCLLNFFFFKFNQKKFK